MIIDEVQIPVTRAWIDDVLKMRIEVNGLKIEDLFVVTQAPTSSLEGDSFIETKYGRLRIFWRNDMPADKLAQILHTSKFKYPVKGNSLEIANMTTNVPHEKVDAPKLVPAPTQNSREVNEEVEKMAAQVKDELEREGWDKKDYTPESSGYDRNGDLIN